MIDFIDIALKFGSLILSSIAIVWTGIAARHKGVNDRIGALEERVRETETTLRSTPGRDEVHSINVGLAKIEGQLSTIGAHMQGQRELMGRLEKVVGRHEEQFIREAGR